MVSAYWDKLKWNKIWYHQHYGEHFVKRYQKQAIKAWVNESFNETNNFGTLTNVKENLRPCSDSASFFESFIEFVIGRYKIDEHWIPVHLYCSICNPLNMKAFECFL